MNGTSLLTADAAEVVLCSKELIRIKGQGQDWFKPNTKRHEMLSKLLSAVHLFVLCCIVVKK